MSFSNGLRAILCACALFGVASGLLSCESEQKSDVVKGDDANPEEASIRAALGVPEAAERVIIFSQAAHMDWDWLNEFPNNVNQSPPEYTPWYWTQPNVGTADSVLSKATAKLMANDKDYYSVCEMGFLRGFARTMPSRFSQLQSQANLRIVGGGITSPDNLLPNGEGFFRNFLVADNWLDSVNIPWSRQVWLPDDFGHDPQLPVMLTALDAMGVGFARIPGACDGNPQFYTAPAHALLNTDSGGVDFRWLAADGSEVIAHWLEDHYSQGANIESGGEMYSTPEQLMTCQQGWDSDSVVQTIEGYIGANGPLSPTPYIYVHVSNDFMLPYQDVPGAAEIWNNSPSGYAATGIYAVAGTFDEYIRLVNGHLDKLKKRSWDPTPGTQAADVFQPNPYWMGYYASRPELKTLHNESVRSLLAAEMYQVLLNTLVPASVTDKDAQVNALIDGWNNNAPSTHHDYVTGTAIDQVYNNEQIGLLQKSLAQGDSLKHAFMAGLVAEMPASSAQVAVFNSLGFDNQGVIEYSPAPGARDFLHVDAPSMGYKINDLATAQKGDGSLQGKTIPGGPLAMANEFLELTIDPTSGDLTSVADLKGGQNVLNGVGNEIVFYRDGGNIYRFGYEMDNCTFNLETVNWTVSSVTTDFSSPLQKSVVVKKQASSPNFIGSHDFTIQYSLRQGEPFVRISTTGSLPGYYTCMAKFPLSADVEQMHLGTPYHWNTVEPISYGSNPDFSSTMWATHDFVMPESQGSPLAAVYHGSIPAWTSVQNALYGVILRNTPGGCNGYGATGSDPGTHTQEYALRVPTGLKGPETGQPLKEARAYHTPMQAMAVPSSGGGSLPGSYSLAAVTGAGFLTTAKWSYADRNALVLRTYQPSNQATQAELTLDTSLSNCQAVSVLEKDIQTQQSKPTCSGSGSTYQIELPHAVATFKLK